MTFIKLLEGYFFVNLIIGSTNMYSVGSTAGANFAVNVNLNIMKNI